MDIFTNQNLEPQSLDQVEEPHFRALERSYLNVILISRSISIIILTIGWLVLFVNLQMEEHSHLVYSGLFVLVTYSFWIILSGIKGFQFKGYALREKDISYKTGWLWRYLTTVSFNRVQHVRIDRGLIERQFGLASIKIFTAGGSGSDVTIPGLTPLMAKQLKDYIVQRTAEDEEE